ncbi:hypothetical protein GIY23_15755 [Allosaccharopolyspora coralli]|uniref:Uncharacterized protein n=1 Tax=Allosaccharopolyspora coralli TaxID=2665642 RepID=A0A5Q3QCN5_9PSEU|nr:hypothetical protein GIY23_15755 [Allosaccharopolyspora coralli]
MSPSETSEEGCCDGSTGCCSGSDAGTVTVSVAGCGAGAGGGGGGAAWGTRFPHADTEATTPSATSPVATRERCCCRCSNDNGHRPLRCRHIVLINSTGGCLQSRMTRVMRSAEKAVNTLAKTTNRPGLRERTEPAVQLLSLTPDSPGCSAVSDVRRRARRRAGRSSTPRRASSSVRRRPPSPEA